MSRFLTTLAGRIIITTAIVGVYVGSLAINRVSYFWLAMGIAFFVTAVPYAAKGLLVGVKRTRDYPTLLKRAAVLEQQNEELRSANSELSDFAKHQWDEGITEGRAQIGGSMLGHLSGAPKLVGLTLLDERPVLIGEYGEKQLSNPGARYELIVGRTGHSRGIVKVVMRNQNSTQVYLACVAPPEGSDFWQRLHDEAQFACRLPEGLTLRPTSDLILLALANWIRTAVRMVYDG